MREFGEVETESRFPPYGPFDANLKIRTFNEMSVQNPEMLCWSDDDRVERFFKFNVFELANFVSKTLSGWLDSFIH